MKKGLSVLNGGMSAKVKEAMIIRVNYRNGKEEHKRHDVSNNVTGTSRVSAVTR